MTFQSSRSLFALTSHRTYGSIRGKGCKADQLTVIFSHCLIAYAFSLNAYIPGASQGSHRAARLRGRHAS
jgi:hypothetical protein